jgi:hypothetical protein
VGNHGQLYHLQEAAIRSLYTEVKERARSVAELLPGSPGTLVKRAGTGHEYWYRSYYPVPRKRSEQFVGTVGNTAAHETMQERIAHSEWTSKQVAALAKFGYLVADKLIAGILVEVHNRGVFRAGMVVSGALAYTSWLNEFGASAPIAKTLQQPRHLELARRQPLKLPVAATFASIMQATQLSFTEVAPDSRKKSSTSITVGEHLTVDFLAPGAISGEVIAIPELDYRAQTVPFYAYLLEASRGAVILAGGHCIPIMLTDPSRMIWYSLYMSTRRRKDAALAEDDLVKGATLAAILIEQNGLVLRESYRGAPRELRNAAHSQLARLEGLLAEHPQARDEFRKLR